MKEKFDIAFRALGSDVHCRCDPSGGMVLCGYCAIHDALKSARKYINDLENQLAAAPRVIGGIVLRGDETELDLSGMDITDLTPLKGMQLEVLYLGNTPVSDLTSLKGMPLEWLYLGNTQVADLTSLQGMSLEKLYLEGTPVSDLTPLQGMPLTWLDLDNTQVADLTPLTGMPLEVLDLEGTPAARKPRPEWLPESCVVYGLE